MHVHNPACLNTLWVNQLIREQFESLQSWCVAFYPLSTPLSPVQYILNEKEVQAKTELWMKQNEEYLREQKGKGTERWA